MVSARASAAFRRAAARTPRVSTQRRVTSHRQGPRAPERLVERMVLEAGLVVVAYTDRLMRALEPLLQERFGKRQDSLRHDAAPSLDEVFERVQEGHVSREFLGRMFHGIDQQAANDLSRVVAISPGQTLRGAAEMQAGFVERNVELIQMEERARKEVRAIIEGPIAEGVRVEDIRSEIQERMGVVRSRAELIARDQTLKTYGQIQEARQTDAGIEEYTWSTSLDERVRSRHSELEGTTQRWDSPPIVDRKTGRREHPGGDFQCRCASLPILPTGDLPPESESRPSRRAPPPAPTPIEVEPPPSTVRPSAAPRAMAPEPELAAQQPPPPPPPPPAPPPPPEPPPPPAPPPPPPPPSEPPSRPPPSSQNLAAERARQIGVRALDPVREAQGGRVVVVERARLPRYESIEREREEAARLSQPRGLGTNLPIVRDRTTKAHEAMSAAERAALGEYVTGNYRALRALEMGLTPAKVLEFGLVVTLAEAEQLAARVPDLRSARRALVIERPTRYGTLYRGLNIASDVLLARLLTEEPLQFIGSVNSASYHYKVAREFAEQGSGARVILEMPDIDQAVSALYASNDLQHQAEMIIGKTTFRIASRDYDPGTNTYLFKLEQVSLTKDSVPEESARPAPETSGRPAPPPPGVGDISKFISDGSDIRVGTDVK